MPNAVPQPLVEDIQNYAQNIVDTIRKPLLILDATLRVRSANRAFYQTFQVSAAETERRFIYELGNGQWDIPELRMLLEDIVPNSSVFDDFELERTFPSIGRRFMLLNARKLQAGQHDGLLVLAIEDIYELTYIRKDGTRFPAIVSVTALRDAQENIIGYLLIGTDITARKQVEAERMLLDQRRRTA